MVVVVPANAGTHTPRPPDRALKVETFFKQQMTGVMGPGVRRDDGCLISRCAPYAGPAGTSENRVSHATGPMLAATISKAASAPSSKLPRLAYW